MDKKSWSQMDTDEKIEFMSFVLIISMTLFVFLFLNLWINKKVKQ